MFHTVDTHLMNWLPSSFLKAEHSYTRRHTNQALARRLRSLLFGYKSEYFAVIWIKKNLKRKEEWQMKVRCISYFKLLKKSIV